jgi:hypothetical protein
MPDSANGKYGEPGQWHFRKHGSPLADVVFSQYDRWTYPQPILDLRGWLASNWQWFDPSHAHRMFRPDRDHRPGMNRRRRLRP